MVGSAVFTGTPDPLPETTAEGFDVALAEPLELLAVTLTRMRWPASSGESRRLFDVSPTSDEQLFPFESQRSHWYLKVSGVVPLQVPGLAVRVLPTAVVPVIVGRDVFDGAACVCARAA